MMNYGNAFLDFEDPAAIRAAIQEAKATGTAQTLHTHQKDNGGRFLCTVLPEGTMSFVPAPTEFHTPEQHDWAPEYRPQ